MPPGLFSAFMNRLPPLGLMAALCLCALVSNLSADPQPLDQLPDELGQNLQQQLIWASPDSKLQSAFVAFRKSFSIAGEPGETLSFRRRPLHALDKWEVRPARTGPV
jgi:hypothetical protein